MYKQVSENISLAQKYLVEFIKERQLRAFATKHEIFYDYLYVIAVDISKSVPYWLILQLRNEIAPIKWFYSFENELPEATKYTKKFSDFPVEETAGKDFFKGIKNIREWSIQNNLPYNTIYNFAAGLTKPTYTSIMKMKYAIKPDLWFIHKDELSE